MNPRENSVELYYKALLDDSSDAAQENMQQKCKCYFIYLICLIA